jgi:hypothetical protein
MKRLCVGLLAFAVFPLLMPIAYAANGFRLLQLNGREVKWGVAKPGTGVSLTYAVLTAKASVAGIENCRATTTIIPLLARSALSRSDFDQELSAAFGMWEKAANLHFTPTRDVANADIIIGAEAVADGVGYTDVTSESLPGQPFDRFTKGIVCLNPDLRWKVDASKSAGVGKKDQKTYRLRIVLAHEIGHVLGLDHPSPHGELMAFEYDNAVSGLQPGDIAGIIELYGSSRMSGAAGGVAMSALNR